MSDNYQAVFDAVRSRFSCFNGSELIDAISNKFECSMAIEQVKNDFLNVAYEQQRPSVLFKPKIYIDGNVYYALYGENLQDGVAGFGESPAKAMLDFDKNWNKNLEAKQ